MEYAVGVLMSPETISMEGKMDGRAQFVLVNVFRPDSPSLCDRGGEIYTTLAVALQARDTMRADADNPWIDVFRLEPIKLTDVEQPR